jgi:hypothetical protein
VRPSSSFLPAKTRQPNLFAKNGFDPALRSGQGHDPGEYFGRVVSVSHGFAHADPQGRRCMLAVYCISRHGRSLGDTFVVDNPRQGLSYCLPVAVVYYGMSIGLTHYRHISLINVQGDQGVLYHETRAVAATSTLQNNFDVALFCRWNLCGPGLYFATHPRSCHQKSHNHGAIIALGRILEVPQEGSSDLGPSFLRAQGCNFVRIPRNDFNHITRG